MSIDQVIKIDGCPDEYQPGEASAELSRDRLARCKRDQAPFKGGSRLKNALISNGSYYFHISEPILKVAAVTYASHSCDVFDIVFPA